MAVIQALLGMEADEQKKAAVEAAMAAGRAYIAGCEYGQTVTDEVAEAFAAADASVLSVMRSLIGLDRAEQTISAAAPLPIEVARFFSGLGMRLIDVYGMTETCGAFTANTPDSFKLGTVGRRMAGVEIRIADDGEIQVRGEFCTPATWGCRRRRPT